MPYSMHRVFCATPVELEPEREAFYQVLADFNEQSAMPKNVLMVGVSLIPITVRDKRLYKGAIDENIRDSSYYLLVWDGNWGPPERNFEEDWTLASQLAANPDARMREAVMLHKGKDYATLPEFNQAFRTLLDRWLIADR